MALSKDIVQKYIDSALKSEVLEDSFMAYTIPHEDESKPNNANCPGVKRILLTISNNSEPDKIIKHYVSLMAQVKSTTKFDRLFDILRLLVQQHPHLGKAVCEALLSCEKLDYHNQNSWMRSFELVSEILPTVDYKGVRDILKHILEIIYSLPERFDIAIIPQLDTLYATFSMILDREASLLPAYLSLDELQKKIAGDNAPNWKFAELFYHFIESFRPTAQIFSIVNRPDLLPVIGCSSQVNNVSWRLDAISAKFQLKGLLPYKDKLKEPQVGQVRYLLEQPYSKEMICNTLSLNLKSNQQARCSELVEQMAATLISAMERSEANIENYKNFGADQSEHLFYWLHLSNNINFYIFFNQGSVSFNYLIECLCTKLKSKNLKRGREHLMWAMLQFITHTNKPPLSEFKNVLNLLDVLYTSRTAIPVPPEDFPLSPHIFAAASIWLQLIKRAEIDQVKFCRPLPPSLQLHYDYLTKQKVPEDPAKVTRVGPKDVVYLNAYVLIKSPAYVTNFIDCLSKIDPVTNPNPNQATPLPVALLDSLTTHSKMTILHNIVARILTLAQNKTGAQGNLRLTPALIETYGRLLIYTDAEPVGLKGYVTQVMGGTSAVWLRHQAWHIYHVLLEMYNYRVHHVPTHLKFQMLIQLHNLSPMVYGANQLPIQLSMTMEAAELKLLLGLSNYEALNMPMATVRHPNDTKSAKNMINGDSEELNKVLVLILARSTHITASEHVTGNFLEDILNDINKVTPLSWSQVTLNFFPSVIKDFFIRNAPTRETDRAQLRPAVEEEYRRWKAMANDQNALETHFSQPNAPPLFICVLWKMLLDSNDTDYLNPVVYRILDSIRIRTLSTHLRTFVDYLVYEFANSVAGELVNKYAEALCSLIWKFQIISLDRLLLCMCLRNFDGSKVQVCFFIIQLLLLKISDFKNTVQKFCKMQNPEHWKAEANCNEVNMEFRRRHPEKYYHDFLADNNIPSAGQTLPSFFGNVCLRFIPVFDLLIHRALELSVLSANPTIKIDLLLNEFGCIYKFHDKPLTYLYNTLHYYDSQIPPDLKRKLTATIVGSFDGMRPPNWCLSETFRQYLQRSQMPGGQPQEEWVPNQEYYRELIGRLVDTLQNKNTFYHTDWRFNEFLNVKSHAVHATAIELMALPSPPDVVGNAILDLVLTSYVNQERATMSQWINAIGLVMTALPPSYYSVLNAKIVDYMNSPLLTNTDYTPDILHLLNFCDNHEWMYESQISYLVALTHAIWHHSSTGQIFCLPNFWKMEIKQAVKTEGQFLFVCCLIGPFLPRLERSRVMMDVVVELYEMLGKVDSTTEIKHLNTICDFFYHIKYMFTGDAVKNDIERCIRNFKPKLQSCLRFITHLNISNDHHQLQRVD